MRTFFGFFIFVVVVGIFFFAFGREKVSRTTFQRSDWSPLTVCYQYTNNAGQIVKFCDEGMDGTLDSVAFLRPTWFGLGRDREEFKYYFAPERISKNSQWDFFGESWGYPAILLVQGDHGYFQFKSRNWDLRQEYAKSHPEAASFPENK